MTYTPPALHVEPLVTMDRGDTSELGCAPVVGVKVSDYDCCSTEAWILVGPSLGDEPVLVVETVEAVAHYWDNSVEWRVYDDAVAVDLPDALALVAALAEDYGCSRRCTCP